MTHVLSALQVSRYFLYLGEKNKRKLSNKKLQKLIYYAQAWSLALMGDPLFKESIEAWIHGPVVPEVYHHYKTTGFGIIEETTVKDFKLPQDCLDILNEVWRVYGKYDADYLELLTHNEDPWIHARNKTEADKASQAVISHSSMFSFYSSLLKKYKRNEKTK